jgi:hypothetical protein
MGHRTADLQIQATALCRIAGCSQQQLVHYTQEMKISHASAANNTQQHSCLVSRNNNEVPRYKLSTKAATFKDEFTFSQKTTSNWVFDVCFFHLSNENW